LSLGFSAAAQGTCTLEATFMFEAKEFDEEWLAYLDHKSVVITTADHKYCVLTRYIYIVP